MTTTTVVTQRAPEQLPTPLATKAALGAAPIIGALALCGAVFLSRNKQR
jgi:hypothetical protein